MTDEHDAFVVGKRPIDSIEVLAKQRGRIGIRITAGINVNPELIMLPDPWVVAKGVNHRCPARRRFLQAVNENHRSPCGIEWLQLSQSGRVRVPLWIYHLRKSEPLRSLARDQHRGWRAKIDSQRKIAFAQGNSLRLEWINKLKVRFLA